MNTFNNTLTNTEQKLIRITRQFAKNNKIGSINFKVDCADIIAEMKEKDYDCHQETDNFAYADFAYINSSYSRSYAYHLESNFTITEHKELLDLLESQDAELLQYIDNCNSDIQKLAHIAFINLINRYIEINYNL